MNDTDRIETLGALMPRSARALSHSGLYHVMARGNGKSLVFLRDADYLKMLDILTRNCSKLPVEVLAWCLMPNHVHLVIEDEHSELSAFMRNTLASYSAYFNWSTGGTGHVFSDRFKSVAIKDNKQLIAAIRYVHLNPQKAGIVEAPSYRWSSYTTYTTSPTSRMQSLVLEQLGGATGFQEIHATPNVYEYQPQFKKKPSEEEAAIVAQLAIANLGVVSPREISTLPVKERNIALSALRETGLTYKQIQRLTGIGIEAIRWATKVQR